nr:MULTISPECIES: glycosyltransferase [unclassified Pseudoalteromonas]
MLFSLSKSNFIKIVVISEKLKDILFQEGVPSDKIEVLHDAADETPEYLLEKVTNSNFNIGYIGHLYEGRGADLVIEVAKKIPNANFHFYGGEESDISNLKNIIDSSNIYFHGFLPPAKIPEVRASLDLLLAPYQESTSIQGKVNTSQYMSPLKIFEYMSSNRPFICSDLPVLREVLVNEHNCILVKPDCIEGWVDAINRVISNQEFSDSIANNALNDFKVKYTWKNRAIKIRGMFDESV